MKSWVKACRSFTILICLGNPGTDLIEGFKVGLGTETYSIRHKYNVVSSHPVCNVSLILNNNTQLSAKYLLTSIQASEHLPAEI